MIINRRWLSFLPRAGAILTAFCAGWVVYMASMVLTVYGGCISLILQPFMAALSSALFVALSLVVGLLLKVPLIARWWNGSQLWAAAIATLSLALLAVGQLLGLTSMGVNPELGVQVEGLHPAAAIGGYFGLIFALANWPFRRSARPWRYCARRLDESGPVG